ncbi:MAG: hypothetical protein GXO48_04650 [Chlorobi bacterium]|nr:hypothetical protein [Chlorobiota bacterium]
MKEMKILLSVLWINIVMLSSCVNPERVIPGTWTVTQAKIDGQEEVSVSDEAQDSTCGQMNASVKFKITSGTITFNENGTYTFKTTYSATVSRTTDNCGSYSIPLTQTDTASGTWTLLGKDKIVLKPSNSNTQAECTIVKIKRKKMVITCPCTKDCQVDLLQDGDIDYVWKETEFTMEKQ